MSTSFLHTLLIGLILGVATPALAVPIVSVDVDPTTPGIQSSIVVLPGTVGIEVDIVYEGGFVVPPLNAFELDLDFNPAVLGATSVVDGGFLLAPVFTVQSVIAAAFVEFAEVTLLAAGATGTGVLATVTFDALGAGTSVLDLNDVVLSTLFGVQIFPSAVIDGEVTVQRAVSVPEPGTLFLFGCGLLLLAGRRQMRLR